MYIMNNRGHRMLPWGTPYYICLLEEFAPDKRIVPDF